MSAFPGVNATLLTILPPGALDRHGDPAAGVAAWEGEARGYLKRQRRTTVAAGGQREGGASQRVNDTIDIFWLLDADGGRLVDRAGVSEGYRVTIRDERPAVPVTTTFRVGAAEHRGGGTVADSQRWELEPDVVAS